MCVALAADQHDGRLQGAGRRAEENGARSEAVQKFGADCVRPGLALSKAICDGND